MKGKIVYISGAMTGIEDYNYPAFNAMEERLKEQGAIVINPARHPIGLEYEQYMEYARLDVMNCDVMIRLEGWEYSKGACKETLWASCGAKDIIDDKDLTF